MKRSTYNDGTPMSAADARLRRLATIIAAIVIAMMVIAALALVF